MKTKKEIKTIIAELIRNEYVFVTEEDRDAFLNAVKKIGLIVCGGAITQEGQVFYIEL